MLKKFNEMLLPLLVEFLLLYVFPDILKAKQIESYRILTMMSGVVTKALHSSCYLSKVKFSLSYS